MNYIAAKPTAETHDRIEANYGSYGGSEAIRSLVEVTSQLNHAQRANRSAAEAKLSKICAKIAFRRCPGRAIGRVAASKAVLAAQACG